jgi:hypothetical protein
LKKKIEIFSKEFQKKLATLPQNALLIESNAHLIDQIKSATDGINEFVGRNTELINHNNNNNKPGVKNNHSCNIS